MTAIANGLCAVVFGILIGVSIGGAVYATTRGGLMYWLGVAGAAAAFAAWNLIVFAQGLRRP
jgi:hypothetical protein